MWHSVWKHGHNRNRRHRKDRRYTAGKDRGKQHTQEQRSRERRVNLMSGILASEAQAGPPEEHGSKPFPKGDTCEQNGVDQVRGSVTGCRLLEELEVTGSEGPLFAKPSERFRSVSQVAEKNHAQPERPKEEEKSLQEDGVVHSFFPSITLISAVVGTILVSRNPAAL
jgi:hypothetical protein